MGVGDWQWGEGGGKLKPEPAEGLYVCTLSSWQSRSPSHLTHQGLEMDSEKHWTLMKPENSVAGERLKTEERIKRKSEYQKQRLFSILLSTLLFSTLFSTAAGHASQFPHIYLSSPVHVAFKYIQNVVAGLVTVM